MPLLLNAQMSVASAPGTGTITLGAATASGQSFAAAGATDGVVLGYRIEDGTKWENGIGVYAASGTTLTRGVIASSNANALETFTAAAIVSQTALPTDLPGTPQSQCRLVYASASQITLLPFGGNGVLINGAWRTLPSGGVSLANTGLTQATTYFVYATWSGSAVVLEASTTGHATSAAYGYEMKSGDATRTLVGMVYTDTGSPGVFVDTAAKRRVASWYNRPRRSLGGAASAGSTTSTAYVEINSANRIDVVAWSDEVIDLSSSGSAASNATQGYVATAFGIDSASANIGIGATSTSPAANNQQPVPVRYATTLAEGYHYVTLLGQVQGGTTGTWAAGIAGSLR